MSAAEDLPEGCSLRVARTDDAGKPKAWVVVGEKGRVVMNGGRTFLSPEAAATFMRDPEQSA